MKLFIIYSIILSSGALAFAESLTLSQAVRIGIEKSNSVKISEQSKLQASSLTDKARSLVFPTITANASSGMKRLSGTASSGVSSAPAGSSIDSYAASLDLSQPLYSGGAVTAGLSYAKANEELIEQNSLSVKQSAVAGIVKAYYDLVDKNLKLIEAKQNLDVIKSYLDITRRYEGIGRTRVTDRLQAEVSYSDSLIEVQSLTNEYNVSLEFLKNLIKWESLQNLEIETQMQAPLIAPVTFEEALAASEKNNPDLKSSAINLELVDYSKTLDLSSDFPSLTLNGSYGYSSPDSPSLFKESSNTYSVSLNLKIPLFSGMSSFSKRSNYSSQKVTLELRQKELRELIAMQIKSILQTIETQRVTVVMQEKAIKEARRAMDIILANYRNGTASSNDVLLMQRTRYDAGKKYISVQIGYIQSVLTLRQLMGIDLYKSYVE